MSSAAATGASCPNCRATLGPVGRCPSCLFTGADTHRLFPGMPPPLEPVCDPLGWWSPRDLRNITAARAPLVRRYPQFRWYIATADLPEETSLSLYGFWLMNVAPLCEGQTETDRLWTVLLLIHPADGRAAAIPGYLAEPWLPDDKLDRALAAMNLASRNDTPGGVVCGFFREIHQCLDTSWKQYDGRRSSNG